MAATSTLKLILDDKEYEASIKDAKRGMQDLQQSLQEAGKTFADVDKQVVAYAKSIGDMETVSKSAKGKLNEMTQTFTELSVQYKQLTEEEKNSPFGKALSESLDRLKTRIQEGKGQLDEVSRSLNDVGDKGKETDGVMTQLAGKFTINIDAIKLFSAGLAAAKGTLDVAKDAFFASESTVDEWGRTIQSAESLYTGFLTALNTGDISGYLSRMNQIVDAAKKAYDEMDKLGTMRTIQSPAMAKQEAENNRLRMMMQTGRWISPIGSGSNPWGLGNGDQLTATQIHAIEQQLQEGMNKIVDLTKTELTQTGNAIEAYYDSLAKQNGMTMQEFKQGVSTWEEFSKRLQGYQNFLQFESEHTTQSTSYSPSAGVIYKSNRDNAVNPYADYAKWGVFRVDKMGENSYNDLVNLIKQQQSQASSLYSTIGQTYRTINRAEGTTVRSIMNGGSGGTGSTGGNGTTSKETYVPAIGSIDEMRAKVKELQDEFNKTADQSIRGNLLVAIDETQKHMDFISGKGLKPIQSTGYTMKVQVDSAESLEQLEGIKGYKFDPVTLTVTADTKEALEKLKELKDVLVDTSSMTHSFAPTGSLTSKLGVGVDIVKELDKIQVPNEFVQTGIDTQKAWQNAASAIVGVGSALNSIQDPASKVLGTIAQAIATMTLSYAQATLHAAELGPFAWIGFATTGLATMLTAISTIESATAGNYATGGIVPGNSFSGDNMMANVNSGELILSKSQQNNIASQLQDSNNNKGGYIPSHVSGEQIYLALNAYTKRTGRGEIVTWK